MTRQRRSLKTGILLIAAASLPALAAAQSAGPRNLAELKAEAQRRADNRLSPLSSIDPADMREAFAGLNSLEPDAWAAAFSRIGDRYVAKAKSREAAAPREAAERTPRVGGLQRRALAD